MKKNIYLLLTLFTFLFISNNNFAQDIEIIVHDTLITGVIGDEMVFDFEVINISNMEQKVFEVRTINDLPSNWQSSLCFGVNCFAPGVDSIATTPEFFTPALQPGDTLITSLHVFAMMNDGTANVQLQIGTFRNPDDRTTLDFVATTNTTSVENDNDQPGEFFLSQNYPNPFNPSTNIKFGFQEAGFVTLKIYDVLGNEIAVLVNEYKQAGNYEVNFNGVQLASGTYLYTLTAGKFSETRKMILEK
jgi:Secretion system C-terminal sorting domain